MTIVLKQGDILKGKGNHYDAKILAILSGENELYVIQETGTHDNVSLRTLEGLKTYFIIPEAPWVPEMRGEYFYLEITSSKEYNGAIESHWGNNDIDKGRLTIGNVYQTRELAEEAWGRVKMALIK